MIPVVKGERLRTLSTNVKEQAQFFPQGYLDSPVLKDVLDPEKVKADWMANSWHLGVAEFLLKLVLEGTLGNQKKTGGVKVQVCHPKWISPWGGSKLDQISLLLPAFGVQYEALPRRLKMGAARMIWEDRDPVRHLIMAKEAVHPADEDIRLESSLRFAIAMAEELGHVVCRWRMQVMNEMAGGSHGSGVEEMVREVTRSWQRSVQVCRGGRGVCRVASTGKDR